MGKIIYESKGKAAEYAKYAFSAYLGCTCGCTYCYNKTGRFKGTFGGDTPTLKKCFRDEEHALEIFEKELKQNLSELQKHGLFFSFTTDPMLPETKDLTFTAATSCCAYGIPVKILTKIADFTIKDVPNMLQTYRNRRNISFGFTLTGHDELETGASTNAERIEAMRKLHEAGFRTWASIEPIITFPASLEMIERTVDYCDLYKIGLKSGMKCDPEMLNRLIRAVISATESMGCKVYFKDGLLQQAGISRDQLPANCVGRDYNIFK